MQRNMLEEVGWIGQKVQHPEIALGQLTSYLGFRSVGLIFTVLCVRVGIVGFGRLF